LKTRFIVNPRSGRATRALPAVREFARQHGADVVLTERPKHASDLAAAALADGCELIVAVGGDGTMNEIAHMLVNTPATLGLVPCGSGDGLGRHLKIHGSVKRALSILHSGQPKLIDSGVADGHSFFTVAGLGFEACIAAKFNQLVRRGFLRYVTTSAKAFWNWRPESFTIEHPGGRDVVNAFTLAVANSDQYGNNAIVAPGARADDGRIDLCVIPPVGLLNMIPLGLRLFNGTVDRHRGVLLRRAERFRVERASAGPLHTDGEIHEAGRVVEFSIRPASLRVMAPAPADADA
jgi:diacylglycerol kinase family enzyme